MVCGIGVVTPDCCPSPHPGVCVLPPPSHCAPGAAKVPRKHFLPLPKPAHLIYIKPTVAVVAGTVGIQSVDGLYYIT